MAKQRPAATRSKISRDKAVIAVLRNDLAARTPGMPAALRERILAAAKPAPRQRKKPDTFFFNLGWTGALLAAALVMAVGVAVYQQSRTDVSPLKAQQVVVPTVWEAAIGDSPALLQGSLKKSEFFIGDPHLAERLRNAGLGGGLSSDEADLMAVQKTTTDAGTAAWFVFSQDGERIAALLAPGAEARSAEPVRQTVGGRALLGFPVGKHQVILVGRDHDRLEAFRRTLKAAL